MNSTEARILGEVEHEPGQTLASIDPDSKILAGLHIDNWDKLPYVDRPKSSIRFAVNGGPGLRGLWIGPSIYRFGWHQTEIPATAKLAKFYDEIDCALRPVPPFTGYIARTEEIVHDGTTLLATERSRLTTWLIDYGSSLYERLSTMIGASSDRQ